ncbi:MAG: flagellar motor switch phosphatase FliY [Syntrophomonas sp.]
MSDGILSQEEIDALLTGGGGGSSTPSTMASTDPEPSGTVTLSDFEKDTLGEVGNISMGTAATTLSTLLRKKVSITTPDVSVTTPQELQYQYPLPYVVVEVSYTEGLSGANILVIKEQDACIIADLMMGGSGAYQGQSLGEMELSAVGEAMNQMMGSATTSLSSMFNCRIDIAPPNLSLMDLGKEDLKVPSGFSELVKIKFRMEIEDLIDSEIMQIIPMESVENIIAILMGSPVEEAQVETVIEQAEPVVQPPSPPPQPRETYTPPPPPPPQAPRYEQPYMPQMAPEPRVGQAFAVQPVQFAPLRESEIEPLPQNIGLIMDVPLDVTVELGKTRKTIKEILELNQGAIIQLDKLAGEPVDLMVNGKLIAKGEVVVIDESYGIRITTIISPLDRMNKLQ